VARARAAGVDGAWIASVERAVGVVGALTAELAQRGISGGADAMLIHATDYLDLFSTVVIAWQWLELAAIAREALDLPPGSLPRGRASRDAGYYQAKLSAAQYWIRTELPRIDHLAALCRDGEDSYAKLDPDWL
jgi:butyryl-CoA dehydrogenase